jgi:hypothetical protein
MIDKNTDINKPLIGLSTDTHPGEQPKHTYRYALNAVDQAENGNSRDLSNENGFDLCGTITSGYYPIGKVYMNDDTLVIFSANPTIDGSEIGILDKNCNYTAVVNTRYREVVVDEVTTVLETNCLNFSIEYQIDVQYRLRRGCEHTVYFANGKHNPVRYFNFSRLSDFQTEDYNTWVAGGSIGAAPDQRWDCAKFRLYPEYSIPSMDSVEQITGGAIPSCTLNFSIRYLDADFNPTPWIYSSMLVDVYRDNQNSGFENILGSSNLAADELAGSPPTNKAVKLFLSDLDTRYPYYQIAVAVAKDSNGLVSKVYQSPYQNIDREEFVFDGLLEGYSEIPREDLLVKRIDYDFADHIEQMENRLLLLSMYGRQVNWCSFQQYASKIATKYIIETVPSRDQFSAGNPKCPDTYFVKEGYMGDEVYAMGIVYVFRDGFESPAFHIPGRPLNKYPILVDNDVTCEDLPDDDEEELLWSEDLIPWFEDETAYNNDGPIPFWKVFDSSYRTSGSASGDATGAMQYHENENFVYPPRTDCEGSDFWGVDFCGNPLAGEKVRHHKFPSRAKEPHISGTTTTTSDMGVFINIALKEDVAWGDVGAASVVWTVNFEQPIGVPQSIDITIFENGAALPGTAVPPDKESNEPVNELMIYSFTGDLLDIQLDASTGDLISTYSQYFDFYIDIRPLNEAHTDNISLRPLGIQFMGVEYPHPDIVGHYFVRAERTEGQRTILDKGIFGRLREEATACSANYHTFSYFTKGNDDESNAYLFSPKFMFNKEVAKPDYIKNECKFDIDHINHSGKNVDDPDHKRAWGNETDMIIEVRGQVYSGVTASDDGHNYAVDKIVVLDGLSNDEVIIPGDEVYNLSWTQRMQMLKMMTGVTVPYNSDDIYYASLKVNRDVYGVLDNIKYYRIHNSLFKRDEGTDIPEQIAPVVYGGDTFISELDLSNSLWRNQKKGIGMKIWLIIGSVVLAVASVFTGGAVVGLVGPILAAVISTTALTALAASAATIIAATVELVLKKYDENCLDEMVTDTDLASIHNLRKWNGYINFANEYLKGIYVENEINIALRQEQGYECGQFYKGGLLKATTFFRDRWLYDRDHNGEYRKRGVPCPEVYQYNKDFSRMNKESEYYALPQTYDCCSECLEEHPHRAMYSEQSFQEELIDNYKIFKPMNYRDIEGEHGKITGVFRMGEKLMILTEEMLWEMVASFQEKVIGSIVSYVGTGDFFSIPPRKMIDDKLGAIGTQHKWGVIKTRHGTLIPSERESKMILLSDTLHDLGREGEIVNDLELLLHDYLSNQMLTLVGIPFPFTNNPANPYGVGIHSAYDVRHNRLIITKKDYLIIEDNYSQEPLEGSMTWLPLGHPYGVLFPEGNVFITVANSQVLTVALGDPDFFENKSWTMSYSFNTNRWRSYHSYIPNFYAFTPNNLYSFIDSNVWKHNIPGIYQTYYGVTYPYIIEPVLTLSGVQTAFWEDLSMQTLAFKILDNNHPVEQRFVTFNKIIAYNSRQSTGLKTITPKDNETAADFLENQILDRQGDMLAERRERDWSINDLRDHVIDYDLPLFLKSWDDIKAQFPIDKVPNALSTDVDKEWYELEILRDKFLTVRFIFDNFNDVQLLVKYITSEPQISE